MPNNIFSGLKVVDLASFIAGPSAAVILSDFGADVIKVEPPKGELWRIGNKIPPQPQSKYPYMWHLNNRNKRGLALDLKSPSAAEVLQVLVQRRLWPNWARNSGLALTPGLASSQFSFQCVCRRRSLV